MADASSPPCTNLVIVGINHGDDDDDLRLCAKQVKSVEDIKANSFKFRDALIS